VGASAGPRSSRCLDPGGWTLLFAGVRFGRSVPRAPSVLAPKRISARSRACCLLGGVLRRPGCWPSARPLFMSALVEPSRDAFQPLTSHVATRHRRVGSCFRPPASASCAALERTGSVSPRDQNRSTVPSFGGAISSVARRWRNDSRRLPSSRNLCLPPQIHTAFQPCTPDASRRRTESFVMPSLLRSSLTPAHRFARVPGLSPGPLRRKPRALRHATPPPLAAHPVWRWAPALRVSGSSSLRRADSPSCGLPCDSTRSTSPMHSTDFCFPLLSTTSTRAAFVPSISSKLAPRPFALGLHPGWRRLGDLTVQDVRSASAGGVGLVRGVLFRVLPMQPSLWHPCRFPVALAPFARSAIPPRPPRPWHAGGPWRSARHTIRDAFHRRPPAPCAGRTHSRKAVTWSFRCDEGVSVSSPAAAYSRTLEPRARRPSLNASRSGEMEVRPLLCAGHCPSTSATTSTTREHDLERPILARLDERALITMSPCRCVGPRFPCASFDVRGMR